MSRRAKIFVLAGVNGAGKSSISESTFTGEGANIFNPDTVAARIRELHGDISAELANAHAWQIGKALLEQAIAEGREYRFETTLGGRTIPRLLEQAARAGHWVQIWFCGLASPELHVERVRRRAERGGHGIPEAKIRERWRSSRENLVRLLPVLERLRVYDNTREGDPVLGERPQPELWLDMRKRKIVGPEDLSGAPEWVQPILAAAMMLHRMAEER